MVAILLRVHPDNPPLRLIQQAVNVLQDGGVVIYPTDATYALGCRLDSVVGLERIRQLRNLKDDHLFTLMCADISQIAEVAQISNPAYRILKACTPGPYTFVLPATRKVPKRIKHAKRKTIGVRIPNNIVTRALIRAMDEPIMSASLIQPCDSIPPQDPELIYEIYRKEVDMVVASGLGGSEPTTVVDLTSSKPAILRLGAGDLLPFRL